MQDKNKILLSPVVMLICILLITLAVFVSQSLFFHLILCLFLIGLFHQYQVKYCDQVWKMMGILLSIAYIIFLVLTRDFTISFDWSIKLLIVLGMILFYISETTVLEQLESFHFVCTPFVFFGCSPQRMSCNLTTACFYIKEYSNCRREVLHTLKLRGLDYMALSKVEQKQYRSVYIHLLKEQLDQTIKNMFDMLEIKLFRITACQTNQVLEVKRTQSIVAIGCCVCLFLIVVVKEVMV